MGQTQHFCGTYMSFSDVLDYNALRAISLCGTIHISLNCGLNWEFKDTQFSKIHGETNNGYNGKEEPYLLSWNHHLKAFKLIDKNGPVKI